VITDNFWQYLKELIVCPVFDDSKYDSQPGRWEDRDMINNTLNDVFSRNTCQFWLAQLEAKRIPCAPVNSLSQALSDEQVLHRNMVVDLKHPDGSQTKGPGNPIKLSRTHEELFTPAPALGQHTDEVLTELLGYSLSTIAELREKGYIK
jgi:crotonobetainyl-CoA:carnitine CoA-transferase CaiB-like acyl-CoA transferase